MNEPAMKDRGWERRLKQLFEELRGEDERAVPPFEDVLARRRRSVEKRRPSVAWRRLVGAAAAVVLLALGVVRFAVRPQPEVASQADRPDGPARSTDAPVTIPWQTTVLLADWQSPTSFLLELEEAEDNVDAVWPPRWPGEGSP